MKLSPVRNQNKAHLQVLCSSGGKILETDQETWDRVFNVNFQGPLNGVNQFLPHMLEHGEESHIVNTASFSGIEGHGHQSAYGSSKFAMVGFSEFLRNDLAGTNVGVSVLCPHVVDTPIIANLKKRVDEKIAAMISDMAVPAETVGGQVTNLKVSLDTYNGVFTLIAEWAIGLGIVLLLLSWPLKKWMHGVK